MDDLSFEGPPAPRQSRLAGSRTGFNEAARYGIEIDGAECFVTHEPCLGCTKLLIQAHVSRVVYLKTCEYPNETGRNASRLALCAHASQKQDGTRSEQFDQAVPEVKIWNERLKKMKRDALNYAKRNERLKGELKPAD